MREEKKGGGVEREEVGLGNIVPSQCAVRIDAVVFVYVGSKDDLPAFYDDYDDFFYDPHGMSYYLTGIDWQYLLSVNLTADSLWAVFHSVLLEAIELHVPSVMAVGYIKF